MRDPPLCSISQLQNGTYTINDLADMHEAMDAEAEHARRVEKVRSKR